MNLRNTDAECVLHYLVDTDFGTFGIVELCYGEESSMVIVKKDDEFAIAHCLLKCCRGDWEYDNLLIAGEVYLYYNEDENEKCLNEVTQVLDYVVNMHAQAENSVEIYNILYKQALED